MEKRINEVNEKSFQVKELFSSPPSWLLRSGIIMILSFLVLFLIISWLIRYPNVVLFEVSISSPHPQVGIYSRTSGKIKLNFSEKDSIKKGDVIASIESPGNIEHIKEMSNLLDTLKIDSIFAKPSMIPSYAWNLGDLQESYNSFLESIFDYKAAIEYKPVYYKKESIKKQITRTRKLLSRQYERQNNFVRELELAEKSYKRNKTLYTKGVISLVDLETSEKELLNATRLLKNAQIGIENTKVELIELGHLVNDNTIVLNRDKQVLRNTIKENLQVLKVNLEQWEITYLIVSPSNGILYFTDFWINNQYVNEGMEIAVIIPEEKAIYFGNAQMSHNNSGEVKKGQKVIIRLDGYNYREYGTLTGHVSDISAISRNDRYRLKIELPHGLMTDYGKIISYDYELKGEGEIITEELSLLDRYFYQFKSTLNQH